MKNYDKYFKKIQYSPSMKIRNIDNLPGGLNANFLECIKSHIPGEYIAKAWHRKEPKQYEVLITFA